MDGSGKSDRPIVPRKPTNNPVDASMGAEGVEGRGLAKGNSDQQNSDRAQDRVELHSALDRIRRVAREDKGLRFTTLWHHVYDIRRLRESFLTMRKHAAAGVDGVTWDQYAEGLEVKHWHEVIGEPTVADAILDRLVSSAHRIDLKGKATMRGKQEKKK